MIRLMILLLIIGVGGAIGLVLWDSYDYYNFPSNLDVDYVKLMPAHGGPEFNVVHCEIIFTVDKRTYISIGGDAVEKKIKYNGFLIKSELTVTPSGQGFIIHHSGPLQLADSRMIGDEVNILIRHGGSQTEVVAVVEWP